MAARLLDLGSSSDYHVDLLSYPSSDWTRFPAEQLRQLSKKFSSLGSASPEDSAYSLKFEVIRAARAILEDVDLFKRNRYGGFRESQVRRSTEQRPLRDTWAGYGSLLGHSDGTIRLLKLEPGHDCDDIRISLPTGLIHAKYCAVSYAWGNDEAKYKISLNNKPFYVRQNLFDCLYHLRDKTQPRLLWIDAICIYLNRH